MTAIDKIKVEEYEFLLEYQKEQDALPYVVRVFKDGEPFVATNQEQISMHFPAYFSRAFLVECCRRFVANENLATVRYMNPA